MPILEYLIPCQGSSIDQRTGAASLFGLVEALNLPAWLASRPADAGDENFAAIEVVTSWRREPHECAVVFKQVLTLTTPGGNERTVSEVSFSVPRHRHRLHVAVSIPPPDSGGELLLRAYLERSGGKREQAREFPIPVVKDAPTLAVPLQSSDVEWLSKDVRGRGGFQSFFRRLQAQVSGDRLMLSESDAEQFLVYSLSILWLRWVSIASSPDCRRRAGGTGAGAGNERGGRADP